ncbi:MAG: hypothetical protein NZM27_06145 [Acetobacteraceae bacterium]|nr:hypothetical protein [Acetobacteraceae bacterium]MDW8397373.1 hypothetical protein [Acetobacteraceae bacterium]
MLILAVVMLCVAVLLAVAFGLAPLGAVIYAADPPFLNTLQAGIQRNLGPWVWDEALLPVLESPSWAVPASLGVLFLAAGLWARRG